MMFVAVFLVGLACGVALTVLFACLVVASEGERELEEMEKRYDGW